MILKVNDAEFKDVKDLLGGFITNEQNSEGAVQFNLIASPDLSFNVAMQLLQSITHQLLYAFITQKPEAKEDVYDAYNFMASSILNSIIPDKELRPDIDEEAILELESKKIEEEFDKLTPEQKEKALSNIETIKARLNEIKKA